MKKIGAYEKRGGDTRRLYTLRRLVDEQGGAHVARLLVEVLRASPGERALAERIEKASADERGTL